MAVAQLRIFLLENDLMMNFSTFTTFSCFQILKILLEIASIIVCKCGRN